MSAQVTITIPTVPVVLPTTEYDQPVAIEAGVGQTTKSVALGFIENNGNVDATLQIDVSNLVDCTVKTISMKKADGSMQHVFNQTSASLLVGPSPLGTEVAVEFGVTPGNPGDLASQATATIKSTWV